jgi:tRNA pseudouridine55 synthase
VLVDKEPGWTSHDVVAKLRGIFHQPRTGHAGTLDPAATGVLVVGLGKATRLLRYLQATEKTYEGLLKLGETTSTLDAEGEVMASFDMAGVEAVQVQAAASDLTGLLLQVPPMVSAIKVDGRRLHELAREGREVERAPRPITVEAFEVEATDDPLVYRFAVRCSTGTYVRSLIDDLGRALGGGAHLRRLRRTAVGSFGLDETRSLEQIAALVDELGNPRQEGLLLSCAEALREIEKVTVDAETSAKVAQGTVFEPERFSLTGPGPWAMLDQEGALLAVYELPASGRLKPSVVLLEPDGQQ